MQIPRLLSSSAPKTCWGTIGLTRAHPWRWTWPWVHSKSGNRHETRPCVNGLLLGMTSKPCIIDDCHMTSSVDAFEFKSIASTSSRYGVESRHQRAQHNISDELEPSPSVLSCKVAWSSASYSVKHDFKIENTLQVDWRHERYSSLNSRWIVGTWWVMQTITRPRHEQAFDDHPTSWKIKQEHREMTCGTLDWHVLSCCWFMLTEKLARSRTNKKLRSSKVSRDRWIRLCGLE